MNMTDLNTLLQATSGPSTKLDQAVSKALGVPHRDYSSSVDACLALIIEKLPTAHWHVGRAEDGVSVYATLTEGDHQAECTTGTVPLALLAAVVAFLNGKSGENGVAEGT